MSYDLVIVESPGKVKKIAEYLGSGFRVVPTFGHFRDLPDGPGIEVAFDGDRVTPHYVVTDRGKKAVAELKRHAKEARSIYLASDADREGEAIAWHVVQVLGAKKAYRRAVFTEITATAITTAIAHARALDNRLVDAQQARRVLDRVVGWVVSPTVRQGTGNDKARSAGRVQSVAVRLVVDRERAITSFKPLSFFSIDAGLTAASPPPFRARLVSWQGAEVGQTISSQASADDIITFCKQHPWWVLSTAEKPATKAPPAPFDTSTLQQAASVALKWKPKDTMAVAQRLYEAGLITYMRTDSFALSKDAVTEIRSYIAATLPAEYLPASPVVHATSAKGAQEAHEAIRATKITVTPHDVSGEDGKLYQLIWTRTIACQMAAGRDLVTTIQVGVGPDRQAPKPPAVFLSKGTVIAFDGWRKAVSLMEEERVDDEAEIGDPTESVAQLPRVTVGDDLKLGLLKAVSRTTKPPPRYTQASLIKALKHHGVGRPSTYAPIMDTILKHEYIQEVKGKLGATDTGCLVVDFLVQHFGGHMIDIDYTARLESDLDRIAAGEIPWQPTVARFAREVLAKAQAAGLRRNPLEGAPPVSRVGDAGSGASSSSTSSSASPDAVPGITCPQCSGTMVKRSGSFGQFLSCATYPKCKGTRNVDGSIGKAALRSDTSVPAARTGGGAPATAPLGHACPLCSSPMVERRGPVTNGRPKFHFWGCSQFPRCRGMRNPDGSQATPS